MGPFGYTFHSPVCPRHQAQNSESNCWSSDFNEWFTPIGLFGFNNKDTAEKTESTQRNMQETQMTAMALSAQRPPTRRLPLFGQPGPGGP